MKLGSHPDLIIVGTQALIMYPYFTSVGGISKVWRFWTLSCCLASPYHNYLQNSFPEMPIQPFFGVVVSLSYLIHYSSDAFPFQIRSTAFTFSYCFIFLPKPLKPALFSATVIFSKKISSRVRFRHFCRCFEQFFSRSFKICRIIYLSMLVLRIERITIYEIFIKWYNQLSVSCYSKDLKCNASQTSHPASLQTYLTCTLKP